MNQLNVSLNKMLFLSRKLFHFSLAYLIRYFCNSLNKKDQTDFMNKFTFLLTENKINILPKAQDIHW
jgi:hypothetical protein